MIKRLVFALLLCASALHAQEQQPSAIKVFLMTMGPGNVVWERFGHNGIVIEDPSIGSYVFDWGRFSFDQPGYVRRLMKGMMLYWTDGAPTELMINHYTQMNRTVWLQQLNLTPAQATALRDFVLWNVQEANKFYRYDYYRDNCSTRVRDAIDRVLAGQLKPILQGIPTDETYRSHTERLTFDDPLTYTGLQLAMGPNIDTQLTAWEESFIPMELMEHIRKVKVRDASGREVPLVAREFTVFEAQRDPLADKAPSLTMWYLLTGVLIAGALILLAHSRTRPRRLALAITIGLWCFILGFFGTIITLLWAATDHMVTYRNENLLQVNPLLLALAVLGPAVILAKPWAVRIGVRLAWVIAGLSVLGFVIQVLPGLDQVNGEIIALFLPIHLAIAYVLSSSPLKTVTA